MGEVFKDIPGLSISCEITSVKTEKEKKKDNYNSPEINKILHKGTPKVY